jgi:hypothetical protein
MSFDLFAQRFVNGHASEVPILEVLEVLHPFLTAGPDEDGVCRTRSSDGGEADFHLQEGRGGFMVNHFSKGEASELIHRAASTQGFVLFGSGTPAMLTDPGQLEHLPQPLASGPPLPVLVASGSELEALILGDANIYRRCRERLQAET